MSLNLLLLCFFDLYRNQPITFKQLGILAEDLVTHLLWNHFDGNAKIKLNIKKEFDIEKMTYYTLLNK